MARYLLFALLAFVAWLLLKRTISSSNTRSDREPPPSPKPPAADAQDMVPCAHCGVHLPASDAVCRDTPQGREYYCGQEHLQRGPSRSR